MGHVNNAKYFTYCESARMSYFAAVRMTENAGRASSTARRSRPPTSTSAARSAGRPSSRSDPRLRDRPQQLQDGVRDLPPRVAGTGGGRHRRVVWVDYATGRSIPLPEALKAEIRRLEGMAEATP